MKIASAIISAALSCALLLLPFQAIAAEDDKAKLANLKTAITSLEKQLNKRDKDKNKLAAELKKNEVAASASSKKIRQLNSKINTRRAKLAELGKQQRQLKIDINKQNAAVSEQLAAAYKMGAQEPVKLLLNQEDPQQLARLFKYYNYVLDARNEKIDQYMADIQQLSTVQTEVIEETSLLDSAKIELQKDQQQLLANNSRRQATLKQLNAALQSDKSKLDKLLKQRSELEELLKNVRSVVKKNGPDNTSRWPELRLTKRPITLASQRQSGTQFRQQTQRIPALGWLVDRRQNRRTRSRSTRRPSDLFQLYAWIWAINYSQSRRWLYEPLRPQ